MGYRKPLITILNDLITGLAFPVNILKVVQTGTVFVINVDNAYFAQKGFSITIGGKPYKITAVDAFCWGDQLTVTGGLLDEIIDISFNMYTPYFFYGTLTDGGIQLAQQPNASQKTPLIFLRVDDTLVETYNDDPEDSHERSSACKIYFLSQGDDSLLNPDALAINVEPMKRLAEIFNKAIKEAYSIFEIWDQTYELKLYAKFGVYTADKQQKKVWTDDLSGCGMDVRFKILRDQTNSCHGCGAE